MKDTGPSLDGRSRRAPGSMVVPAVVGLGVVETLLFAFSGGTGEAWGAALIPPAVVLVSAVLFKRVAEQQDHPYLAPFLMWALVLKLLGALVRYWVFADVYGRVGDAKSYHTAGSSLAKSFRSGVFDVDVGKVVGTGFIEILTGVVYTVLGSNQITGFLVFSWIGFLGLFFFYRAFCLAFPNGDRRRYALLLFFLPSMLFWPSSIGKEAWMMFTLGVAAYGAARVLTRSRGAFLLVASGLLGTAMVRPHVTLMLALALPVAYVIRRSPERSVFGPVTKLAGVATLCVGAVVVVAQAEKFLGVDTLDRRGIDETINNVGERTDEGGSSFQASRARSPAQLPYAAVSVLFRPFPHEAHNLQAAIASLEGVFLLGCFVLSWRRVRALPGAIVRSPYVTMAILYSLLFIYAFSSFGNFGIITRERVQVFPFILIIFALPALATSPRRLSRPTVAVPALTR